jgi:meiotically up-regulated gene 157 (Mug157) protein
LYYLESEDTSIFDSQFLDVVDAVLNLWTVEQDHTKSPYRFERDTWRLEDTLTRDGLAEPVGYTGMTWSAFRPSDDRCIYNYLVPSNMFASVVLGYLEDVFTNLIQDKNRLALIQGLKADIDRGIEEFAVIDHKGQEVYAYEVDGLGNATIMDDANVPNLMSASYLGFVSADDTRYQATRDAILSPANSFYYEGEFLKGIGSSHTPENYVWTIALAMQGLTAQTQAEKSEILDMLASTTGGTMMMHEGIDVNDPTAYTREWFSWANMMFCELVMQYFGTNVKITKG